MTDRRDRIKALLDTACEADVHRAHQCPDAPPALVDGRYYSVKVECWQCHFNDQLAQEIAEIP